MMCPVQPAQIQHHAPIETWFGVGGQADTLVTAQSMDDLLWVIERGQCVRVLGEGANLLVADEGIDGIVVSLDAQAFKQVTIDAATQTVTAGAGVDLRRLITRTTNAGLAGLEVLGGIPASIGGAVRMNAGGTFGQIADTIARVHLIDRRGLARTVEARDIPFGYRCSGLEDGIITHAEFVLHPEEPAAVRDRLRTCMAAKSRSQPMEMASAGCVFKNPQLEAAIDTIAPAGTRVSAGLLIDRAGCKGLRSGGAEVSDVHANFLITHPGATATDLLALMSEVQTRVFERFGVRLEREVVVWSRES
jgi:UDP-N-acetylmuramate dehydrogenase